MGKRRRVSSGAKSPQPTNSYSGTITRSRSRAPRSATSLQSEMAPALTQEEASGSPTARKRLRLSPSPRGRRRGITSGRSEVLTSSIAGEEFLAPASASTAGEEEVDPVTKSVAPEARDSMENDAAGHFVPNSPIRMPYMVEYDSSGDEVEPLLSPDPVLFEAYEKAKQKYSEKIGQLLKLPTLDDDTSIDSKAIEESSAETILKASKFILTTADIFCSKSPNLDVWLGGQEYALDAEVKVKLLHKDDIEVKGKLAYLDKQYGFALITAPMDRPKVLPCSSNELMFAGDIFLLGRDKWDLQVGDGKILNKCAGSFQHHHYMYFDGDISLHKLLLEEIEYMQKREEQLQLKGVYHYGSNIGKRHFYLDMLNECCRGGATGQASSSME